MPSADETRLRIIDALRTGDRTATELAGALRAPRTTLLHHLAQLRVAGLIETSVGTGNTTVYGLRPAGFEQLARVVLSASRTSVE